VLTCAWRERLWRSTLVIFLLLLLLLLVNPLRIVADIMTGSVAAICAVERALAILLHIDIVRIFPVQLIVDVLLLHVLFLILVFLIFLVFRRITFHTRLVIDELAAVVEPPFRLAA
jgi:hypothetical protein